MRTFTFAVTIIMLFANTSWVAKTHAQGRSSTFKDTRMSVEIGGKAYERPGSKLNLPLITDANTFETLFDSNQATDLGTTAGAEVKFNFLTKGGREIEVRTILANWDENTEIVGNDLRSPFFPVAGFEPTTVNFSAEADYFSIEVMERRAISPGITFMFGPRFISAKDRIDLSGTLGVDGGPGIGVVDVTQNQSFEATNSLIGLQAGFEFNFPVSQDIYLNSFIRTGGYYNPTETTRSTSESISTTTTSFTQTKATGSFVGEVGGRVYFDVIPNCVSTYAGYEATWIDGMAAAPAQALTTGSTGVETANTPFFHAFTFGVNMSY
ncbi:MAG: hypothetical protein AB8B55_07035 [Mariniblastus sp.]